MLSEITGSMTRYAGWAAYASVAATLVSFVFLIVFFTVGQPFGTLNDIFSVFQVLFMLPLVWALHTRVVSNATISWVGVVLGVIGILTAGGFQTLLVLGRIGYEESLPYNLAGGGAIGVWLIISNALALQQAALPRELTYAGIVAGIGYVLLVIGFWVGGQSHPLFIGGGLATLVGYIVWGIWLGRLLLNG